LTLFNTLSPPIAQDLYSISEDLDLHNWPLQYSHIPSRALIWPLPSYWAMPMWSVMALTCPASAEPWHCCLVPGRQSLPRPPHLLWILTQHWRPWCLQCLPVRAPGHAILAVPSIFQAFSLPCSVSLPWAVIILVSLPSYVIPKRSSPALAKTPTCSGLVRLFSSISLSRWTLCSPWPPRFQPTL